MTIGDESDTGRGLRPFIGRAHEVSVIDQCLDEVESGLGCSLVIAGEPGIGKSALADEALRRGRARRFATARAYCAPIDGHVQDPIADVLTVLQGHDDHDHPVDPSPGGAVAALRRLSSDAPLMIVVEDVHWAGDPAITVVEWLARRLRDAPILWVLTARSPSLPTGPTSDVEALRQIPGVIQVDLSGFTVDEVGDFVGHHHGSAFDTEAVSSMHDRCRGNPLLVEELARAQARGEPDLTPLIDKLFGDVVRSLDAVARDVLTVCALAGGTIRHELLRRVEAATAIDVPRGVEDAVRHGVLVRRPELAAYACRHPLLTDVAVAAVPADRARRVHAALADALAAEPGLAVSSPAAEIAHHRCRAGDDAAALDALLAAADEAESLHAPGSVLAHLQKALDLCSRVPRAPRGMLLMRAAYAAEVVGRNRDAVQLARQAVSAGEASGPALGQRHLLLAELLRRGHHPPFEADAAVERAAELIGDDRGPAGVQLALAGCWHWDRDPRAAVIHGHRAIEQAEAMAAPPFLAQALVQTGGAMTLLGEVDEGIALARRGREVATESGFEVGALTSCVPIAAMHTFAGRPSHGADEALAGLRRCDAATDSATLRAALAGWAAYSLFSSGRWAEASDLTVEAEADGIYAALLPLTTARLAAFEGKAATAATILETSVERGVSVDPHHAASAAWAAWCAGDLARAHQVARAASRGEGLPAAVANELCFLAAFCAGPGDGPPVLPEEASGATTVVAGHWAVSARAAARDDEASWSEALDSWQQSDGWPHMVAICSARLAMRTSAPRAHDLAAAAFAIARRLSSPPLESLAVAAAASAGVDLQIDLDDPDPHLTPRESEVLRWVSTGASNRQIARTLGISEGTVSVHVSNLLRKLGVGSRTEAAVRAARGASA
ncbi:transcriptional regulator, LuxR family [Aeromicrobium marinum DSM 15272]|uniref:Transcriptional regulator, LuxR family n=1 Tax=Aeromicrobium marinum DSM 15272 TaxID=585531 RepID=E2S8S5_9ACTN|nr:LuxR family transcriptional regulator [Aeromicrobium marinum]EFQ84580.1 transcriptional regulator, LuxR family [Aeromicrobium marinum DSM 15272]